jgi:hypothetical protein
MVPRKFHSHQLGFLASYPARQQSLLSELRKASQNKYILRIFNKKTLHNIRKENNYRLIHRALKSKIPVGICVSTRQPVVARAAYHVYVTKQVSTEQPTTCT